MHQAERRHKEKQAEHGKAKATYIEMKLARIEKLCGRGTK